MNRHTAIAVLACVALGCVAEREQAGATGTEADKLPSTLTRRIVTKLDLRGSTAKTVERTMDASRAEGAAVERTGRDQDEPPVISPAHGIRAPSERDLKRVAQLVRVGMTDNEVGAVLVKVNPNCAWLWWGGPPEKLWSQHPAGNLILYMVWRSVEGGEPVVDRVDLLLSSQSRDGAERDESIERYQDAIGRGFSIESPDQP